jgi:hypothetical protein
VKRHHYSEALRREIPLLDFGVGGIGSYLFALRSFYKGLHGMGWLAWLAGLLQKGNGDIESIAFRMEMKNMLQILPLSN